LREFGSIAPSGGGIPPSIREREAGRFQARSIPGWGWTEASFAGGGVRGRRSRLRNGLGTFALVVIVADPAQVRLFAVATKFGAHRNPLAYRDVRSERLDVAPLRPLGL
jgi:hypothetical protein